MKISSFLAGLILLAACNNDSKKVTVTDEETGTKTTMDAPVTSEKAANNFEEKVKELQALAPMSLEDMKALLPESLAGAARSDMNVQNAMGASFASAKYKINDNTSVELGIFDCAGPAGAGIYSMQFLTLMNFQQESETEMTRTVDFNGSKAIERAKKDGSESSFHWFAKDRFLVSLEGENMKVEELRELAGSMKF